MKNLSVKQFLLINIIIAVFFVKGVDWTFSYCNTKNQEILPYQLLNDETKFQVSQSIYLFQNWVLGSEKVNVSEEVFANLQAIQKELRTAIDGKDSKYLLDFNYNLQDEELNQKIKESNNNISAIIEILQIKYNYQLVNQKRHRVISARSEDIEKKYVENFEKISKQLFLTFEEIDKRILILSQKNRTQNSIAKYIMLLLLILIYAYYIYGIYKNQLLRKKSDNELNTFMQHESERMGKLTKFVQSIRNSNFEERLDIDTDKDEFADSIVKLKAKLKESAEEEQKQSEENKKRSWITQGLAWASDVLRDSYDGVEDLSYNVISGLVKYLDANQGGLFIINEDSDTKFLELTGAFAYEQRKYLTKHIQIGEGLVGMCFQEEKTVYLKKVPDDYVKITSGLGEGVPKILIIVPLKFDDKCFGVIEIASFTEIEKHQIEFLENVGESIASTISSARINQRTAFLLEQSNQQAEEMKAQEEEMRQNMEEMQATQEEASRREAELKSMLMAVDFANIVIEYDLDGNIISANNAFASAINKPVSTIVGDNHKNYSPLFLSDRDEYIRFWNRLLNGEKQKVETNLILHNGNVVNLLEAFSPIFDQNNHVVKIVNFAVNVTELSK